MVKFKKLWLFERSEFQRFLNFIIAQFIAEIRPGSEIIYMNIYKSWAGLIIKTPLSKMVRILFVKIKYVFSLLVFTTCLALLFVTTKDNDNLRSLAHIWNLGHILLFVTGAFLITRSIKGIASLPYFKQLLLVVALTILIGGGIERLQLLVGRQCSFQDVLLDIYGTLAFFAFFALKREEIKKIQLRIFQLFVALLLLNQGLPLAEFITNEITAKKNFPVLSDFETFFEKERWKSSGRLSIANNLVTGRGKSLKVDLLPAKYANISLDYFPSNWEGFKYLKVSIFYTEPDTFKIYVRIHDELHEKKGRKYKDRYNSAFFLKKGWNNITISLNDVQNAPSGRKMDMSQIKSLLFFAYKLKTPISLYIDDVKLTSVVSG